MKTLGYLPYGYMSKNAAPFDKMFPKLQNCTKGFEGIDAMIIWGGTDIHPSYYRAKASSYSGAPTEPSQRDIAEWKAMLYCKANNIPIIGICRGAQFLCAFAGGTLAQHVGGHGMNHEMATKDGRTIWTTSVHHQMMNPWNIPHELIAWATPSRSKLYLDGNDENMMEMRCHEEPEIVFFPEVRGLGIQGHPEYPDATKEFTSYCCDLVQQYLFAEEQVC